MTNGQNAARARHLESVADATKRYILREILDVTQDVAAELEALTVAFTGATSIAGGASGFVPAPAAGDDEKFLRGDGTGFYLPLNCFRCPFSLRLRNVDRGKCDCIVTKITARLTREIKILSVTKHDKRNFVLLLQTK